MSIFTNVKGLRPKKNAFNLSHQIAQTQDIGQIMPCYVHDGILPNSREKLGVTSIVRFQALLAPLQHKVDLYAHFWYVPYRIIDKDFTRFISGDMMRNNETYNCPVIRLENVMRAFKRLTNYNNADESIQNIGELIFNPSGLLSYLNYPSFPKDLMPDFSEFEYDSDLGFADIVTEDFNVKRLQAYFYIIAQNYINENFTLIQRDVRTTIDLTAELFNFALGDFEFINDTSISESIKTEIPHCTNVDICLARILYFLYCRGLRLRAAESNYNSTFSFPHAWKKDYFTSALPFVQIGNEVGIPIDSIHANNAQIQNIDSVLFKEVGSSSVKTEGTIQIERVDGDSKLEFVPDDIVSPRQSQLDTINGDIVLDDIESAITINELRAANALQSLKEAFARFGTRFQEWLQGFWNQKSSDRSQNLPEWLGGYKVPVQISEIEQTSATLSTQLESSESPLGTLAGKGLGIGGKLVYNRHFEEPGVIIGLCFLQPKAVYPTSGIDRFLLKTNNIFDYLTPKMEHLGEQEVYRGELFYNIDIETNHETFGYQSRYAEYKQIQSKYRGQFADVLNFWHLGRSFNDTPVLGNNFIYIDNSTMKRPFAVNGVFEDGEYIDITNAMLWFNFDVKYIAPMSRFGTPALLN